MHHQPLFLYNQSHPAIEPLILIARFVESLGDTNATNAILAEIEESKENSKLVSSGKGAKNG